LELGSFFLLEEHGSLPLSFLLLKELQDIIVCNLLILEIMSPE